MSKPPRRAPHASHLEPEVFDDIRIALQDDHDMEAAVEMLMEQFPDATDDEIMAVAVDIERAGE